MKNSNFTFVVCFLAALLLQGCKKEDESTGLSEKVQTVIPKEVVDQIKSVVPINEGKKPPVLAGYYVTAPYEIIGVKNSQYTIGEKISNYVYKFSGFSSSDETVDLSYRRVSSSQVEGIGSGAVVSGYNNRFTLYAKTVNNGNDYYEIYSGEITSTGIKDWVDAIIGIDQSTGEIEFYNVLKDSDGLADKTSTENFRKAFQEINSLKTKARL